MSYKFHPDRFWYIFPMLAVSVDNKYLFIGWLCFSVYFHFGDD